MSREGIWRIPNPGKTCLKLDAAVVRDVNVQKDVDRILYARKEMIRTEISLNENNIWEER